MAEEETTETTGTTFIRRGEDFESLYANNVYYQPSEWDLKITFGELDNDPKDGKVFVDQHTAIAVPWLQAKLMNYFLTLQLGVYEMAHGKIAIPPAVMPPIPDPPHGDIAGDASAQQVFEYIAKVRKEFFSDDFTTP
jgi:hypothetical protein